MQINSPACKGCGLYSEQTGKWTHLGLVACSTRAEARLFRHPLTQQNGI